MSEQYIIKQAFIDEFDAAIEAHMNWNRRILRCTVLHEFPGPDVMHLHAHQMCSLGKWIDRQHAILHSYNADAVQSINSAHHAMHEAMRNICANAMKNLPGNAEDLDQLESSQSELMIRLSQLKTQIVSHASQIDPLTELPLRHRIEADFKRCQREALRNHTELYIAIIDIDHFKHINDQHGHTAGDAVIRQLALNLKHDMRAGDYLYRYGGEEFLWLIHCNSAGEAEQSARRAIITTRTRIIEIDPTTRIGVTITLGITQAGLHEDLASAIVRADRALYRGKDNGRNMYVIG